MRSNGTRNQHFVSQVEQKLNASNPNSTGKNFRIFSFRIADRDAYRIELEDPRGFAIKTTLSLFDLYSFDVEGGGKLRMNLEELFRNYEDNVEVHTKSLLEKLAAGGADVKTELIELFTVKLLNFVRNPYCVQKVLNSFPSIGRYEPTDPELLAVYRRVIEGRKRHQSHLCEQLGISQEIYVEWLQLIFVLLMPIGNPVQNLFEGMIKGFFEGRDWQASIFVWTYDDDVCLLSDRSFCQRIPDGDHMSMSFNLCSYAFVDYAFADPAKLLESSVAPAVLTNALSAWRKRPQATVSLTVTRNNREMLASYNRRVIEQARERVFCAKKDHIVLE